MNEVKRIGDKVEKILLRTIVITALIIVIVQGLMVKEPFRLYLSWGERLEGQRIEYPVNKVDYGGENEFEVKSPYAFVVIKAEKYDSLPEAVVLVNNREVKRFTSNEIKLKVMGGDRVEIDSTFYNVPVEYKIKDVSPNLSYPEKGMVYRSNGGQDGGMVMIGEIIVK
ncbi:hypothetical protein SAMN02745221_01691 [Thermosyntropha lipolytica DSM 11003]|uniref:Uncharacterized protein n=1 Tax=Thermosyntropha lipolytica DSM 11003 TaxID=1123382 RepID=A0A1M5Q8L0_9FIRM|nr:hypothetical protein [Thermosyntropha lipolytica]SHH10527.1 hypothetical protein SAMN02745221_01691 [Thermosyntropha lipolytica DSM 11003]